MFEASQAISTDCSEAVYGNPADTTKRQYTVKGIEADTVALMRDAARHDGMKIGSWVSTRMREAAEQSLFNGESNKNGRRGVAALDASTVEQIVRLAFETLDQRNEARLARIEAELHSITSAQRTIMAQMIASSVSSR